MFSWIISRGKNFLFQKRGQNNIPDDVRCVDKRNPVAVKGFGNFKNRFPVGRNFDNFKSFSGGVFFSENAENTGFTYY